MSKGILVAGFKGIFEESEVKALAAKKGTRRVDTVALEEYNQMETKPKLFRATASTVRTDRGKDAMIPQGVMLGHFANNAPLQIWHKGDWFPIGKIVSAIVGKDVVDIVFHFDEEDEFANQVKGKYERGVMRAFSIGFMYKSIMWRDELVDENGIAKETIDIPLPDGTTLKKFKVEDFGELPRFVVNEWELFEVSACNVGMNGEALLQNIKEGIGDIKLNSLDMVGAGVKSFLENDFDEESEEIQRLIAKFQEKWCDKTVELPKIVKSHSILDVSEEKWDKIDAEARLLGWASEDGSGDKDKIDWYKFSKGFVRINPEEIDKITSFSFCHHTIEDGKLVLSKQGLVDSTLDLLKSNLPKEEKEEGLKHLSKHFADLGKDMTTFNLKSEQDLAELANIFKGKDAENGQNESDSEADTDENEVNLGKIEDVLKRFDALEQQIKDGLVGIRCKINVLSQRFEEYVTEEETQHDEGLIPGEEVDEKVFSSLAKTIEGFGANNQ